MHVRITKLLIILFRLNFVEEFNKFLAKLIKCNFCVRVLHMKNNPRFNSISIPFKWPIFLIFFLMQIQCQTVNSFDECTIFLDIP